VEDGRRGNREFVVQQSAGQHSAIDFWFSGAAPVGLGSFSWPFSPGLPPWAKTCVAPVGRWLFEESLCDKIAAQLRTLVLIRQPRFCRRQSASQPDSQLATQALLG
jgi:hypothetical protein